MTLVYCEQQNAFYFQVKKAMLEVTTHFPQQPLCNNPLPAHCPILHPSLPPQGDLGPRSAVPAVGGKLRAAQPRPAAPRRSAATGGPAAPPPLPSWTGQAGRGARRHLGRGGGEGGAAILGEAGSEGAAILSAAPTAGSWGCRSPETRSQNPPTHTSPLSTTLVKVPRERPDIERLETSRLTEKTLIFTPQGRCHPYPGTVTALG